MSASIGQTSVCSSALTSVLLPRLNSPTTATLSTCSPSRLRACSRWLPRSGRSWRSASCLPSSRARATRARSEGGAAGSARRGGAGLGAAVGGRGRAGAGRWGSGSRGWRSGAGQSGSGRRVWARVWGVGVWAGWFREARSAPPAGRRVRGDTTGGACRAAGGSAGRGCPEPGVPARRAVGAEERTRRRGPARARRAVSVGPVPVSTWAVRPVSMRAQRQVGRVSAWGRCGGGRGSRGAGSSNQSSMVVSAAAGAPLDQPRYSPHSMQNCASGALLCPQLVTCGHGGTTLTRTILPIPAQCRRCAPFRWAPFRWAPFRWHLSAGHLSAGQRHASALHL